MSECKAIQCNVVQRHHHSRHRDIMGGDLADGCPGGGRELDREMRDRTGGRGQEGRGGGGAGERGQEERGGGRGHEEKGGGGGGQEG